MVNVGLEAHVQYPKDSSESKLEQLSTVCRMLQPACISKTVVVYCRKTGVLSQLCTITTLKRLICSDLVAMFSRCSNAHTLDFEMFI